MNTMYTHLKTVRVLSRIIFCLATIVFISPQQAKAGHIVGAEITYKWISGNTYVIHLNIYRDCDSPIPAPNNPVVKYSSVSCNKNNNITLNELPVSGYEITRACSSATTTCNGGINVGIQKFEYEETVTLSGQCNDWIFGYDVCCRNCNMTTVATPGCSGAPGTYVEATLNNIVAPTNSSPSFAFNPIQIICTGQPFQYNNGTIEIDGDSLVYSFITPRQSAGTNITFTPPYSGTSWVTSSPAITINSANGDVTVNATQTEISAMAVLVREYRNGVLVGSIVRDVVLWTKPCSNTLPAATGINGTTNFSLSVCAGVPINFNVFSSDTDPGQSVTMTTNNGIPGSTFTSTGSPYPTGHFSWTPTVANARTQPYVFSVMVEDNGCPQKGNRIYSYSIKVSSITTTSIVTNSTCATPGNGSAIVNATGVGPFSYAWTPSVSTSAFATGLVAGTYSVTVTESHGCTSTKTIVINSPSQVTATVAASSNVSCNSANDGSIAISASGGISPYTYQWSPSGGPGATAANLPAGTYTIVVKDANLCTQSVQSIISQPTVLAITPSTTPATCNGFTNAIAGVIASGGVGPYSYYWTPGGSTTNTLTNIAAGNYTIRVTDSQGCTKTNTINVTQPTALSVNVTNTQTACAGSTGTATANITGGISPYTYQWSTGATSATATGLAAGGYSVVVSDANGCTLSDAAAISNLSGPTIAIGSVTPLNCNGDNNGSASVNVITGVHPLTYQWSPSGGTQQNANGLSAGTYTVTVTDGNGCAGVISVDINEPTILTANVTPVNPTCNGSANGSVSTNVSGGTAPYTYSWAPGNSTGVTLTNSAAGTYQVKVTDNKGCTTTASTTLSQPTPINGNVTNVDAVSCFGGNNGSASVSVSGGTSPYDYSWSPSGGNLSTAAGLSSGNYSVIITDANNCTSAIPVSISQPSLLVSSISPTHVLCNGSISGSATVNSSGGTSPYNYVWNPALSVTATANGLAPGTYSVIVSDANGCSVTTATAITQPTPVVPTVTSLTNLTCFGSNNGTGAISTNGGVGPYSYSWSPSGGNSSSASGLTSGVYTIMVTDANQCTATSLISINEPAELMDSAFSAPVTCNGLSDGSASFSPYGGTGPYTYNWYDGNNTNIHTQLAAGNYSVTVTDAEGCTLTQAFNIIQPAPIAISPSVNSSTCGNTNGSASVNVSGGTSPFSYQWNTSDTIASLSGLSSGTYTVQITDAHGCTSSSSLAVASQPGPQVASSNASNVLCNGGNNGSISINATGGTGVLHYAWSPSGGTNATATGLSAGTYNVIVTDANGCTITSSTTITQPTILTASSGNLVNVNCFGNQNGQASVIAAGGTLPYQFQWIPTNLTTPSVSGLAAGSYSVKITDANSCLQTVSINITQPALLTSSTSTTDVTCYGYNNGSASVNVSGGTGPYTYNWNPGGNNSAALSSVIAGNYSVSITDNNGCNTSSLVTINQPALLHDSSATTGTACGQSNGTVTLFVTGGSQPYNYSWSPGGFTTSTLNNVLAGSYTVQITDSRNCSLTTTVGISNFNGPTLSLAALTDVSCAGGTTGMASVTANGGAGGYTYQWAPAGGASATAQNLAAGTYSVQVTDASQCITSIPVIINEPQPVSIATVASPALCNGSSDGGAVANVTGGVSPYQYSWSNGATTAAINGLQGGNYSAVITDNNGCTETVAVTINQPSSISLSVSTTLASCSASDGSASVIVSGGSPSYQFQWTSGGNSPVETGLSSGPYSITITDANGCTSTAPAIVSEQTGITLAATTSDAKCNGSSTGTASVQITGGVQPFTYTWFPSVGTTASVSNLSAGIYIATINDVNGCTAYDTISISEPTAMSVSVTPQNEHCFGTGDGSVSATATGGVTPYSYLWNNGATTLAINNLSAGNYSFTATDLNGCSLSATTIVNSPSQVTSAIAHIDPICIGQQLVLTASASGGNAPYHYSWQNGPQTAQYSVSPAINTNYSVSVSDSNGCSAVITSVTVPVRQALAALPPASAVICEGDETSLTVQPSGGTGGPYTYTWSNGVTTQSIVVSPAQTVTYTVTITDNCTVLPVTASIPVTVNPKPSVRFTPSPVTGCAPVVANFTDQSITSSTNCTYSWNFGDGSTSVNRNGLHTYANAGNYTVTHTVTDNLGCSASLQVTAAVQVYPNPEAAFVTNPEDEATRETLVTVTDQSSNVSQWIWDFGDNSGINKLQNPSHQYSDSGEYTITLITISNKGCVDSTFRKIKIQWGEFTLFIPNAFTPNGDNKNDGFIPVATGINEFDMYIFDRWGLMLYHTTSLDSPWNGKVQGRDTDCQNDVYVYKVIARDTFGASHEYVGHLTLVR